jgi:hypothetical protein
MPFSPGLCYKPGLKVLALIRSEVPTWAPSSPGW